MARDASPTASVRDHLKGRVLSEDLLRVPRSHTLIERSVVVTATPGRRSKPPMSDDDLKKLVEQARSVPFPPEQREEQRRSFAFGNTHFENQAVTRQMVDEEADALGKNR